MSVLSGWAAQNSFARCTFSHVIIFDRLAQQNHSWLNAQLSEAVKFSSPKDQSTLQDQHFP
jgi:hypothetical protein